jgi:cytochrome c553
MKKYSMIIALAAAALVLPAQQASAAGDAEAGKTKSAACAACHGPDGNSPTPAFPKLAGQQKDYIYHSLKQYKAGSRKNPIMAGQVANLSIADMEDLAAYFSSQSGLVVKH